MSRPRRHLAVILVVAGLVCFGIGLEREHVDCARARGTCTITAGPPQLERRFEVALAEIRGHEFVEERGRSPRGHTIVLDQEGRALRLGAGPLGEARARHDALAAFLGGRGDSLQLTTGPSWTLIGLGLALLVATPFAVRDGRRAQVTPAGAPARDPRPWIVLAAVLVLALVGAIVAAIVGATQGTLELRCDRRCEVAGLTCEAGSRASLGLAPGEHEVRVFTPEAPGGWTTRRVTIAQGGATAFTCAP